MQNHRDFFSKETMRKIQRGAMRLSQYQPPFDAGWWEDFIVYQLSIGKYPRLVDNTGLVIKKEGDEQMDNGFVTVGDAEVATESELTETERLAAYENYIGNISRFVWLLEEGKVDDRTFSRFVGEELARAGVFYTGTQGTWRNYTINQAIEDIYAVVSQDLSRFDDQPKKQATLAYYFKWIRNILNRPYVRRNKADDCEE